MRLENKKALVTGAYRGIGKVIADLFIAEGAEVWGLDYKTPDDISDKLHWVTADLSELSGIEKIIESVIKESGGFNVLVNNAGITKDNLSFRMSL
ncbi:MAG: SDR family NAD(P)-dependent oxidoreductase, partial [Treponema sp.]|nr:SDR family NAD(P)-dependent oxidoreductase [Treponema sp.]